MEVFGLKRGIFIASCVLFLTGCWNDKKSGEESNVSTSQSDKNTQSNTPQEDVAGLKSLTLTIDKNTLNKDDNTTVKVIAIYEDGSSKDVTDKVEWVMTPNDAVQVTYNILIANKDNPTILKTKLGNILSNSISLDITWVVNGYTLPPEPDKTVNDSTLLGVDVNGNGVRDDVERAIYQKFPKEIRKQVLMQRAKSHQRMLADDNAINNARKWQKIITNKNIACAKYLFRKYDIDFNLEATDYMKNILYNNKDRVSKYMQYSHALGGGVYFTPESIVNEDSCEFNITQVLKVQ